MTLDEAKKIIKSECYIADLLDLDRTQTVNIALDTVIEALEQEPQEDCISRAEAIKIVNDMLMGEANHKIKAFEQIQDLPSVKPQRTKGYWNFVGDNMFECTCCGNTYTQDELKAWRHRNYEPIFPNFCPNCGADMRGSDEE